MKIKRPQRLTRTRIAFENRQKNILFHQAVQEPPSAGKFENGEGPITRNAPYEHQPRLEGSSVGISQRDLRHTGRLKKITYK